MIRRRESQSNTCLDWFYISPRTGRLHDSAGDDDDKIDTYKDPCNDRVRDNRTERTPRRSDPGKHEPQTAIDDDEYNHEPPKPAMNVGDKAPPASSAGV